MAGGRRRYPVCQQSQVSHCPSRRANRSTVVRWINYTFFYSDLSLSKVVETWTLLIDRHLSLCICRDGGLKRTKVKASFKEQQQKQYSSMVVGDDSSSSNSDWPLPALSMSCFWRSPGSVPLRLTEPDCRTDLNPAWGVGIFERRRLKENKITRLNLGGNWTLKVPFKVLYFKGTTFKVQCDAQKLCRGCSCIISQHIFNDKGESHSEIIGFWFSDMV